MPIKVVTVCLFVFSFFIRTGCCTDFNNSLQGDGIHFVRTGLKLAQAPFRFDKNDWTKVGLVVGSTALLFTADKGIRRIALSNQSDFNDKVFNVDQYYGNGFTGTMTAGIYGFGLLFTYPAVRLAGLRSMEAYFYTGVVTGGLKFLIGRRRPFGGDSHLVFKMFQFDNLYRSLPSGHTSSSFAVSTVLAKSVDNLLWKSVWYGAAGLVGVSRMYHNVHWFSDVVLGGILGYSIGNFVVNRELDSEHAHLFDNVLPYYSDNTVGIMVRF
jgi:membrane-associated phospholipid phosphatase